MGQKKEKNCITNGHSFNVQAAVKIKSEEINIIVSKSEIAQWLQHEELVSFEFCVATHSGPLMVLIERDFKCLTPRKENEDGLFDNPNEKC